jgi:hypothetical protein
VTLKESLKKIKKTIPNPCAAGPIPAGGTNKNLNLFPKAYHQSFIQESR